MASASAAASRFQEGLFIEKIQFVISVNFLVGMKNEKKRKRKE
jgi:hypothetical protein